MASLGINTTGYDVGKFNQESLNESTGGLKGVSGPTFIRGGSSGLAKTGPTISVSQSRKTYRDGYYGLYDLANTIGETLGDALVGIAGGDTDADLAYQAQMEKDGWVADDTDGKHTKWMRTLEDGSVETEDYKRQVDTTLPEDAYGNIGQELADGFTSYQLTRLRGGDKGQATANAIDAMKYRPEKPKATKDDVRSVRGGLYSLTAQKWLVAPKKEAIKANTKFVTLYQDANGRKTPNQAHEWAVDENNPSKLTYIGPGESKQAADKAKVQFKTITLAQDENGKPTPGETTVWAYDPSKPPTSDNLTYVGKGKQSEEAFKASQAKGKADAEQHEAVSRNDAMRRNAFDVATSPYRDSTAGVIQGSEAYGKFVSLTNADKANVIRKRKQLVNSDIVDTLASGLLGVNPTDNDLQFAKEASNAAANGAGDSGVYSAYEGIVHNLNREQVAMIGEEAFYNKHGYLPVDGSLSGKGFDTKFSIRTKDEDGNWVLEEVNSAQLAAIDKDYKGVAFDKNPVPEFARSEVEEVKPANTQPAKTTLTSPSGIQYTVE